MIEKIKTFKTKLQTTYLDNCRENTKDIVKDLLNKNDFVPIALMTAGLSISPTLKASEENTQCYNYSYDFHKHHSFLAKNNYANLKALKGEKRDKMETYLKKYVPSLDTQEKLESFLNLLFFESSYRANAKHINNNGTIDYGPCQINNGATAKELIKHGIIRRKSDLKKLEYNFKAAEYILKNYGPKRWYGAKKAKKYGLFNYKIFQ